MATFSISWMIAVRLHWAAKWRGVEPCRKIIVPLLLRKCDVAVTGEVVCTAMLAPAARRTLMHAILPTTVAMCRAVSPFASWPSIYLDSEVLLLLIMEMFPTGGIAGHIVRALVVLQEKVASGAVVKQPEDIC